MLETSKKVGFGKSSFKKNEARLGILFILPSVLLISSIIIYPVLYNLYLSFHKVALNPRKQPKFIGLGNYTALFSDGEFFKSLLLTFLYVILTVTLSTITGLLVALLMNRKFKGRGIARSLVILPYVAPVIASVYVWQYMFNGIYGVFNYITVDKIHLFKEVPPWFDHPILSLVLVVLYDVWRVFPYSFMMILAALQAIDETLYEAAKIDGAGAVRQFFAITLPEIMPVVGSLVILRSIWNFYKFDDVYLLTKQVPIMGVYLYQTAFSVNDFGLAAAITVVLFFISMSFVVFARRRVR
ncbi:Inner membrane ABC transporter permease protein YcjO [Caloramator mitchellensis]|uniref:Inner membrane ABC transporter permease protein YcjO n=1 Tax=Caloramator mitchellensis TaxID=908809 RepID=A0A0R3JVS7_CALMK|nr:sugar ABC transporter permease [Caloramator mitchellensis]KRQ87617.1 Inner membrane ABC transporter permease protein YcjO [Caloramator mitchellensis]